MNDIALSRQVEAYEQALRAAVPDLPDAEADEMVHDLRAHLAEVAAEQPEAPLADLVGPPDRYAAELRAAAGYAPLRDQVAPVAAVGWTVWLFPIGFAVYAGGVVEVGAASGTSGNEGYLLPAFAAVVVGLLVMLAGGRAVDAAATSSARGWQRWLAGADATRPASYLRDLSAAAWALRGWGAALVVDLYLVRGTFDSPMTGMIPRLGEYGADRPVIAAAGWLAATCVAVLISVRLGGEQWRLGKWRLLVLPVTVLLAAVPAIVMVRFVFLA